MNEERVNNKPYFGLIHGIMPRIGHANGQPMTSEQLEELLGRLQDECDTGAIHDLYAAAPSLARRVIAAEKLVEALARLGTPACFGSGEALGMHLPDSPLGREILSRMGFAQEALTAYREASK